MPCCGAELYYSEVLFQNLFYLSTGKNFAYSVYLTFALNFEYCIV